MYPGDTIAKMADSIRGTVRVQPIQGEGDASDWHWLSLHNTHGATLNVASIMDEEVSDFLMCTIKARQVSRQKTHHIVSSSR